MSSTRQPGGDAARRHVFLRLGREGYEKIQSACYDTAESLAREIAALGPFEMLFEGDRSAGIPALG